MALNLSIIQGIFGIQTGASAGGNAATAIPTLRRALAPGAEAKGIEQEKKDPITISELAQFRKALEKSTSLESALRDPRISKVILSAIGLADQTQNTGLVVKALTSDPADTKKGLANLLGGSWKTANDTLKLKEIGIDGLKSPEMIQTITSNFLKYQYRSGLDDQQTGISDALYFMEEAKNTNNIYSILANPVLRRVVQGSFGIPQEIVVQPIETQAKAITARLKLADLQKPKEVQKLVERYLILSANNTGPAATPSILELALSMRA